MATDIEKTIRQDPNIRKFCFYGFFKNLKFFEPYLYLYLINQGFSFFLIGTLFSIQEAIVYLMEIPSGVFADNYGKKTALIIAFSFYIASFAGFFFIKNFAIAVIAISLYALGEAFRSGTHKALIYNYLEHKNWFEYKTLVYGRTRSFSLIGSALSAILSIAFIIGLPSVKWLFLLSILPYLIDALLVISYPQYLDEKQRTKFSASGLIKDTFLHLKKIIKRKKLLRVLINSAQFDASFKVTKDYIQPILKTMIMASPIMLFPFLEKEQNIKAILGITYALFYIFSAAASRNIYKLTKKTSSVNLLNTGYLILAILMAITALIIKLNIVILIPILFFALYIVKNARRPIIVDVLGDIIEKTERATVLSVDSQLRSIAMVVLSPLFGLIADTAGLSGAFIILGALLILLYPVISCRK
ncbi:MFS transporter [Spirochaetia bacterium 38H-sp]|uniref:MFS transporter n=1 Tax=Rarispira pelagica TaxID=3141764 RepID=A0ABU9UBT1_9SPIR